MNEFSKLLKLIAGEAGTISVIMTCGNPNLENIERKCSMVFCIDAVFAASTSIHLEWESIANKNILPMNGPT